ncbi:MAG: pyridoxal-phosphate dependent enzyme [Thermomicrobiales bacterium]
MFRTRGFTLSSKSHNPRSIARRPRWNSGRNTEGQIDILVGGFGTGGTITGAGQVLKALKPEVKVVAIPNLPNRRCFQRHTFGPHKIQGIGANFIPGVLDRDNVDEILTIGSDEAIEAAREVIRTEGLLIGISGGAAAVAGKKIASRPENAGKLIVVVLPDTGERYLSTLLFNELRDEVSKLTASPLE